MRLVIYKKSFVYKPSRLIHVIKLFRYYFTRLDHTYPVSNIKGIEILAQTNVTLLQSSRGDKCVDLITFNLVKLLNSSLDLAFVGLDVNNENKGIAILDKLHR